MISASSDHPNSVTLSAGTSSDYSYLFMTDYFAIPRKPARNMKHVNKVLRKMGR